MSGFVDAGGPGARYSGAAGTGTAVVKSRRFNLGLVCAVLVLVPALVAAELAVRGYEQRAIDDVQAARPAGLDSLAGLFDQERIRTLNNAEVAGERLGPLVAVGHACRQPGQSHRRRARRPRCAAPACWRSSTAAATRWPATRPATCPSAPRATSRPRCRAASPVGWQERGLLVLEAASPLRNGGPMPGAAVAAVNVDDGYLNTALRLTGLEMAVVDQRPGRRRLARAAPLADQRRRHDRGRRPGRQARRYVQAHTRRPGRLFHGLARHRHLERRREIGTMLIAAARPADRRRGAPGAPVRARRGGAGRAGRWPARLRWSTRRLARRRRASAGGRAAARPGSGPRRAPAVGAGQSERRGHRRRRRAAGDPGQPGRARPAESARPRRGAGARAVRRRARAGQRTGHSLVFGAGARRRRRRCSAPSPCCAMPRATRSWIG